MGEPQRSDEWDYLQDWTAALDGVLRGGASLALTSAIMGIAWKVMWHENPIDFAKFIFGLFAILGAFVLSLLIYNYLFHVALRFFNQEAQRVARPIFLVVLIVVFAFSFISLQVVLINYVIDLDLTGEGGVKQLRIG